MSPEQATGAMQLDGRSDVYSLGCVLYEMLAGHPPFLGTTAQEILARHALDPVPPLRTIRPELPQAVEHAVRKALAKSPADRFPDRKSTRLNSSHTVISYAVFCLKKKNCVDWAELRRFTGNSRTSSHSITLPTALVDVSTCTSMYSPATESPVLPTTNVASTTAEL